MNWTTPSQLLPARTEPLTWQQKLAFVGKAHHTFHPACETCHFNHVSGEARPYGEGVAHEVTSECRLEGAPERCAALQEFMSEQEEA